MENRKLKAQIVLKHGNQFAFSLAVGEHESTVSKVIKGKLALDPGKAEKWAAALGVKDSKELFEPK